MLSNLRITRVVGISASILLISFTVTSCGIDYVSPVEKIRTCDKTQIESKIKFLYNNGTNEIKNIPIYIDWISLNVVCEGTMEARSPLQVGLFPERNSKFSIGWDVKYSINEKFGICITRTSRPASAGIYKECYF